ncbi:MAG: queuosine precursor transporter [Burkholderiales bacterium]|nr:queuosine precursor transporter [Burkholderiales bacterium]
MRRLKIKSKQYKYYSLFGMILVAIKLGAMLFVGRNLLLGGVIMPGGIIPFCTTFFILDIVTNNYGLANARKMIFSLLLCEAIFSFIIYFTLKLTPVSPQYEASFKLVTQAVIRLFFGSFTATIVAYFLNCYIFSKLYIFYSGKKLWFRCILSTAAGELVFSVVWTFIYFYGRMNNEDKLLLVMDQYIFKVLFEIASIPVTYLIVELLDRYEVPREIKFIDSTSVQ